jgi:hypothetical protein
MNGAGRRKSETGEIKRLRRVYRHSFWPCTF